MVIRPETTRLLEVIEYLERSYTATDIIKKLGSSPSAITELKKNRANAGNKLIQKFTKAFRVNRDWLFTGEGEMFLPSKSAESLSSKPPQNDNKYNYNLETQLDVVSRLVSAQDRIIEIQGKRLNVLEKEMSEIKQHLTTTSKFKSHVHARLSSNENE